MLIEELGVITLADGSKHILINKIHHDEGKYMFCLRIGDLPVLEILKFDEDAVTLVTDPKEAGDVLNDYVNSDGFKEQNEMMDGIISKYFDPSLLDIDMEDYKKVVTGEGEDDEEDDEDDEEDDTDDDDGEDE